MRGSQRLWLRIWAAVAAFTLVAAACSGSRPASDLAERRTPAPGESPEPFEDEGEGEGEEAGDGDGTATGTRGRTTARTQATVAAPGQAPQVTQDETGRPVANLFKPEEDTIGFTDSRITLCMHAAFVFGEVFDNRPEDERVYWHMINDQGGIHGREVHIQFHDDAYNPDQARSAAERCMQDQSFLILSGVGFDQIPAVREWAEANRQLYFHSMATEQGAMNKHFSFAVAPTVELMGRQIAQFIATRHPNKRIAVISRDSSNWDGALKAFVAEMKRRNREIVAIHEVSQNQGNYAVEINDLRARCPQNECIVYVNENVLAFAQIYQQARGQAYRPQWFNYGFQLVNDTIGSQAAQNPPIQAWYPVPAFDLYNETNQPWYSEIQRMQQAYQKYRPQKTPNDVDWMFWVSFKALHRMLHDCGADCTRNRLVGMLLDGYRVTVDPLCEANFGRGHPNFGAWQTNIYQSVPHSRWGAAFKQIETCKEGF